MRRFWILAVAVAVAVSIMGCGKKQETLEEMQAPMSIESLSTMTNETVKMAVANQSVVAPAAAVPAGDASALQQLPPSGPYNPTGKEIQTALKNAGLYNGAIDGKVGPMTKKAIEEFQKANNLKADGKVGPKTWAVLSGYLNTVAVTPTKKR